MPHHDYRLRQAALETLQPLYEASTDRRTRGAMNRGINTVATSDPSDLFQRFPDIADAVGGDGKDLLKLLTKNEVSDTKFGSFGSGFGLEWHHRNMSLGELGKEARKLTPDVFQEFTLVFGEGGVKFGQNPAQMRIQAKPTHVPDGIRGYNWLTSHAAGKSPFRLPTWSASTTAAEAIADAAPIVNNNIAQSDWAESLTPHQVTTERLTNTLGYNPLENQENLSMVQRKDIGKALKKANFKAFSVEEAQSWIKNNASMLADLTPEHMKFIAKSGIAVGALGFIGDAVQAAQGVNDIRTSNSDAQTTAGALNVTSAALGLSTLVGANPVTAIPAITLGGFSGAIKTRIQQDQLVQDNFKAADPKRTTAVDPYENNTQIKQAPKPRRMGRWAAKQRQSTK